MIALNIEQFVFQYNESIMHLKDANGTASNVDTSLNCVRRALDKREYLMIIFLILIETICCDPSSEPSH